LPASAGRALLSTHVFNALAVVQSIVDLVLRRTPETAVMPTASLRPQPDILPVTRPITSP
jgi:hypothetical protein